METKNKELTVEEINAYLENYDLKINDNWELVYEKENINIESYYPEQLTREKFEMFLGEQAETFDYKKSEDAQIAICSAINEFNENFDKCMAEFHAKDNQDFSSPKHDQIKSNKKAGKSKDSQQIGKKI